MIITNVDIVKIAKALSSDKRLKMINILSEMDQTAVELYNKFKSKFDNKAHRETIYRDLELLQLCGVVTKKYDNVKAFVCFALPASRVTNCVDNGARLPSYAKEPNLQCQNF